ncbi:MAG: MATE family efflux transporter [Lachnospiraceae bacterium]|jgi:putative MATE family efflux protein|nr:MATE family efflux transporter [Lachnospiraceae bacterium]
MAKNNIQLSDHFHYRRLLRFTMPAILMLIFTSVYSIVDGFFVSNFTGKTPFAAVNFIMPLLMILGCAGFMFGTGGGALIAKTMGVGDRKGANELFSLVVYAAALSGVILAVFGIVFLRPLASLMGADGQLLEDSVVYGRIILLALPFYVLQYEFQCLFAAAEKPKLGLYVTVAAGIINIVLDALFVAILHWGLAGAAAATAVSQFAGGIVPIIYFARRNDSPLRLGKCRFDGFALAKTCTNGSSELMSNISMSVVSMLFNIQLMKYAGENGIAAYGVLMYVSMIFQAVFIGYSVGAAPVISYNYGAQNCEELKSLRQKSMLLIAVFSVAMLAAGQLLAQPLSMLFVGYDEALMELTVHAFTIFSFSFLLSGFSIWGASFFTALNDGLISALISFLRTFLFQCAAVLIFPLFWGLDGIWFAVAAAELLAAAMTALFLLAKKKKYRY